MADFKHFIDIDKVDAGELRQLIEAAKAIKADLKKGTRPALLEGKQLAMIFEKASTRTRVSFEVGINQLGGNAIMIAAGDSQLGRGESIGDTAKVLSRYVDIIMLRTFKHETLLELADKATVPVINGLTDYSHPCQVMTDIMTFEEHRGSIEGKVIAWSGDFNNVALSWAHAAEKFNFTFRIACPEELWTPAKFSEHVQVTSDVQEAIKDADLVVTDTWMSMGDTDGDEKMTLLKPYQVNDELMRLAKPDALFMHCLPAHREEEVTGSVIDGPQSVVFDEAENRLHAQKAIMLWCLNALPAANGKSKKKAA